MGVLGRRVAGPAINRRLISRIAIVQISVGSACDILYRDNIKFGIKRNKIPDLMGVVRSRRPSLERGSIVGEAVQEIQTGVSRNVLQRESGPNFVKADLNNFPVLVVAVMIVEPNDGRAIGRVAAVQIENGASAVVEEGDGFAVERAGVRHIFEGW